MALSGLGLGGVLALGESTGRDGADGGTHRLLNVPLENSAPLLVAWLTGLSSPLDQGRGGVSNLGSVLWY